MGASLALAQRAVEPERATTKQRAAEPDSAANPQTRDRVAQPREVQPGATQPGGAQPRVAQPPDRRGNEGPAVAGQAQAASPGGIAFEGQEELVIREVAPGSAAADAGLRARDRILTVDGRQITGQRRLMAFLGSMAGRRVPLVIEREGRQYTIQYRPAPLNERGAWLGVYLQDNEQDERGARITHIYPTGPAARAGLRPGDVILTVNDQPVQGAPDLISFVDGLEPQSKATFRVLRGDREVEAVATLASRDSFVFHQAGYGDQRGDSRFAGGQQEDDAFADVPPHAMQLEHDRRMAEQHERIENELRKLQEEVRLLREALQRR
jgi:predicted metalloprotease with PDZ domain